MSQPTWPWEPSLPMGIHQAELSAPSCAASPSLSLSFPICHVRGGWGTWNRCTLGSPWLHQCPVLLPLRFCLCCPSKGHPGSPVSSSGCRAGLSPEAMPLSLSPGEQARAWPPAPTPGMMSMPLGTAECGRVLGRRSCDAQRLLLGYRVGGGWGGVVTAEGTSLGPLSRGAGNKVGTSGSL